MFYKGDLQSGILKAIQESKCVACFVRDEGEESLSWEMDFLKESTLSQIVARNAVLLRMQSDSPEAHYLSELYPIPKAPTFIVIRNGQLKEYLSAGSTREDFLKRAKAALDEQGPFPASEIDSTDTALPNQFRGRTPSMSESHRSTGLDSAAAEELPSHDVRNLEQRGVQMESQQKEQEMRDKAESAGTARTRQAVLDAVKPEDAQKRTDIRYTLMQKKRQQAEREERARILKRVEDDKVARREREAVQREQTTVVSTKDPKAHPMASQAGPPEQSAATKRAICAVQVRLFDGTTRRSKFSAHDTLGEDVRKWVSEQQDFKDIPYTFKQILTPLPTRTISISQEGESLEALGLCPSVTLILVPINEYATAYRREVTGIVWKGISIGCGYLSSGAGLLAGLLSNFTGNSTGTETSMEHGAVSVPRQGMGTEMRTSNNEAGPSDHQLYNGNNLNFEPRWDSDDNKD
ncbi:MAG: hypothetical protein M1818_004874 [Claussenomyces sp. TS43310]|nr:MAG: hypothetical protein M1818_004874 [Claussenomyces sp. TS43310]